MAYARILSNQIRSAAEVLPSADTRLVAPFDVVENLPSQPVQVQEECGWFVIDTATNPRPADTPTTYWASRFTVVAGRPVEVWDEFTKTAKMLEDEGRATKRFDLSVVAKAAAFDRLRQIRDYTRPNFTAAIAALNAIANTAGAFTNNQRDAHIKTVAARISEGLVEVERIESAVADEASYVSHIARLMFDGAMLDPVKD